MAADDWDDPDDADTIVPGGTISDGAAVLDRVEAFLRRFIAFPDTHALIATVLWVVHTHAMHIWDSTPRAAYLSPEPGSGKTRVLEILELLVPRPLHAVNASSAALFRSISGDQGPPTILFDEVDTLFGPKAREHEEVRGVLNSGHRKGATSLRCVVKGKAVEIEAFPSYAPVALAGLGDLPDTLMTRSVVVRMRRRSPREKVEPFRHRVHSRQGHALRDEIAAWVAQAGESLARWPDMPDGIEDRNADVWEALLAVADAAGADWPDRARVAAVALVAQLSERPLTLGIRLLGDVRDIFTKAGADRMPTEVLLNNLQNLDEAPWGELRGKPLDARGLSRRLSQYEIKSRNIKVDGDRVVRGYTREDLHDAWERYLPPSGNTATSATTATPSTDERHGGTGGTTHGPSPHADPPDATCADCDHPRDSDEHWQICWVGLVTRELGGEVIDDYRHGEGADP